MFAMLFAIASCCFTAARNPVWIWLIEAPVLITRITSCRKRQLSIANRFSGNRSSALVMRTCLFVKSQIGSFSDTLLMFPSRANATPQIKSSSRVASFLDAMLLRLMIRVRFDRIASPMVPPSSYVVGSRITMLSHSERDLLVPSSAPDFPEDLSSRPEERPLSRCPHSPHLTRFHALGRKNVAPCQTNALFLPPFVFVSCFATPDEGCLITTLLDSSVRRPLRQTGPALLWSM